MTLTLESPSVLRIEGISEDALKKHLTYHDKKVDYEYRKARHSPWLLEKLGPEGFQEHIENLRAQRHKSLLFKDSEGLWTYSGLSERLSMAFGQTVRIQRDVPKPKLVAYENVPEHLPRYYQVDAVDALINSTHGGVEIATGLGKSFIEETLLKRIGLKGLVMVPSKSIAMQMYNEMVHHFGRKRVGLYGDGKKESKKQFTVAIAASLVRIEKGSPAWEAFSEVEVFISDESHLTPAKTLQDVCFGLLRGATYRFFFSGTQLRGDGLDLVLEGITGRIVYRMSVREGIDQGFLAKLIFRMVNVTSTLDYHSRDVNDMTRTHLYYNPVVNRIAADIANKSISVLERPVIILVDEIEQFTALLPFLHHKVAFAHGGVTAANADKLPSAYHKSDPTALVKDFNAGMIPILVGTSCIGTGTDTRIVKHIINLVGGKSEIQLRQGVGRGTRLAPGKTDCLVTDFDVSNVDVLTAHAKARREIYAEVYAPAKEIDMTGVRL